MGAMSTNTKRDDGRLSCPECDSIAVQNPADFDEALGHLIIQADHVDMTPADVRAILASHVELLTPTLGDEEDDDP